MCKNQEFFQLSAEQLANLLKSDDLNVTSEEEVFYSLMEWVQHDQANREKDVPDLLSLIRLPLLAPVFIADHVETLCGSTECQQLVMEALKWHLLPERRSQMTTTHRTRPRKSTMGRLLAVGGMDAHKGKIYKEFNMSLTATPTTGAISIESFCPRLDKWTLLKNMSGRRLQFGVAVMEDKLIIVGGRDGLKTMNSVTNREV